MGCIVSVGEGTVVAVSVGARGVCVAVRDAAKVTGSAGSLAAPRQPDSRRAKSIGTRRILGMGYISLLITLKVESKFAI
jgi:hypothetical protein